MTIQIDKYTKGVLTIIAIALMIIALKGTGLFPKAFAQSQGVVKVAICGEGYNAPCAYVTSSGKLHTFPPAEY
tara:strand:- start:2136 stop:2354 length:219 start_codon:yes stop_codon:yes gene_type:complete